MDGGRGVLRSLKGAIWSLAAARPAYAGFPGELDRDAFHSARPPIPKKRRRFERQSRLERLVTFARRPGVGAGLAIALLAGTGLYGSVKGGEYDVFIAEQGALQDVTARILGFGINGVTFVGARELNEEELLTASGITTRDSLLFLDVAAVRARLKEMPLVRDVSVRKLYPGRLAIDVQERAPFALWQMNGQIQIISADGMAIDQLTDDRFARLPFVVGEDANLRVPEFLKIVEGAGELRDQIRAGVLVSGRRWNLKLNSGLEIKLPEQSPETVFARFAKMAREMRILEKDLISVDLRLPDRIVARLTADAAATRAESLRKPRAKGGQT
ncbi:MAG: FtsQ-type POTRA domain-containing protein [Beijerinckiaceae bacterium]|jgi:cell division protein FtsQ|nr:FtsQ-type POTRA domain-containing protein [Beijerinckiaceae bacterium]MDO9442191.1 FtsQ-type POTRA domain-containing protein [Beijerinckiaceae bacterium]